MRLTQTNNAPSTHPQNKTNKQKKQQHEKQAFNFVGLFKGNPKWENTTTNTKINKVDGRFMEKITKPRGYRKCSVSFQKRAKFQSKAYFNRTHQGDRQESYFFLKICFYYFSFIYGVVVSSN